MQRNRFNNKKRFRSNKVRQNYFFVAEQLGKFVYEVEDMPYDEFIEWLEYYKLKAEANKKKKS